MIRRVPKHFEKPIPADWVTSATESMVSVNIDKLWVSPEDGARFGFILTKLDSLPNARCISVLFGAAFTVATAWAIGMLLFRRLGVALGPHEAPLLASLQARRV